MEPSTPTEEFGAPRRHVPQEDQTIVLPGQGGEPVRSAASASGQHCASCGATLAPDQRYCVECGQRRGPTRSPFMDAAGQQASAPAPAPAKKGPRVSPNTALIAGIGILMLAMATGVLIGRTSSPSSKNAPVQYVTAPTAGAGTTAGSTSSTEGSGTGSTTAKESGKAGSGKSSASNAAAKLLGGKAPPNAVVKPGTPGKGPGYQKGKFTGKFFGGAESKKQEEEEELGEEASEKGKK
jgi:hypothetical protein